MADFTKKQAKSESDSTPRRTHDAPRSMAVDPAATERDSPADVLLLQEVIGNRALHHLLVQREPDPPVPDTPAAGEVVAEAVDNPLTPGQVVKARSYYAMRPELYTPTILSQIQDQVGAPVTGAVTEEMIQAVARFQRDEGTLAVDGMAGPRTLPAAFPSGLAADENEEDYAEDVETLQGEWEDLDTPEARMDEIMEIVNDRLEASDVHPVDYEFADTGAASAQFDFRGWEVETGRARFEGETISDEEMTRLAGTIYHEARHAEQWYRIAQMLAGKGRTAQQIKTETAIDADAIAAAVADPIAPGTMEAVIAQGWYDSVYGRDSAKRHAVLTEVLAAKKAVTEAKNKRDANPTPANEAAFTKAYARFNKAYAAYQNLPEEADAFRVGGETEALVAAELID